MKTLKTLKTLMLFLLGTIGLLSPGQAQNPVKYQAVLRDAQGYVRPNETVSLDLQLIKDGQTLYQERHSITTDALGQLQVFLGQGKTVAGFYEAIDWAEPLTLKVSENGKELTSMPITAVPKALHAEKAASASSLAGKTFADESDPAPDNYYSSEKVQRLIQGQSGQTGLAKEIAERKAEDLRILDSIRKETERRIEKDQELIDQIDALAQNVNGHRKELFDSIAAERKARMTEDGKLLEKIALAVTQIEQETSNRQAEDLRIWDSIDRLSILASKKQNICEASDPKRGIYTQSIPLYDLDRPEEIGLFTMPELKVLRQSGACDLFASLNLADRLDRSFKTRVMTYNTTQNPAAPQTIAIPAGSNGVDVYVDNYRIDTSVEYLTYDVLVFEIEYYHLAPGSGKLYVTLVRE